MNSSTFIAFCVFVCIICLVIMICLQLNKPKVPGGKQKYKEFQPDQLVVDLIIWYHSFPSNPAKDELWEKTCALYAEYGIYKDPNNDMDATLLHNVLRHDRTHDALTFMDEQVRRDTIRDASQLIMHTMFNVRRFIDITC